MDNFDIGKVSVSTPHYGFQKCYKYRWYVDWHGQAGKQPEIFINSSNLSADNLKARTYSDEGGLFYPKIPGEFLRMPTNAPQVGNGTVKKQQERLWCFEIL